MIRTTIRDIEKYFCIGTGIKLASDFIKNTNLMTLKPGVYPIVGTKIFAIIQEVPTMLSTEAYFENHFLYADMQMTLFGRECVGYSPLTKLVCIGEYDSQADVQNYIGEADFIMTNDPNHSISIFFPEDGHQPYVAKDNAEMIKKIVIRISMDYILH